jgi:hypothetical protein
MLALLPFQLVWGAAASYCQHEQGSSIQHFGHHVHKHQGKALKTSGQGTADGKSLIGDDDPDCATCHLTCVSPLAQTPVVVPAYAAEAIHTGFVNVRPPHVPYVIERPNWTLAV